ncbi:MAG: hypothetical protein RSE18_12060, partial [Acinetobacter sp.]
SDEQSTGESRVNWFIWLPIMEKKASMLELKQGAYSLDEWVDLHEAILVRFLNSKDEMDKVKT